MVYLLYIKAFLSNCGNFNVIKHTQCVGQAGIEKQFFCLLSFVHGSVFVVKGPGPVLHLAVMMQLIKFH